MGPCLFRPGRAAEPDRVSADELCFLSAVELCARYRARDLSPVEVVKAVLARIERLQPALNAFVTVTAELALDQAREAESLYAGREHPAPLLGVPVSIKDLTPTRGIRTTNGSLLTKDWIPDFDAPVVERLYAAGAVILGKTNTPEYGWKGDTTNRVVGSTHNPWQHGRTAGGSSGGAAAAVAAGLGPLAQGSDGAGSIRIPASFCGVFGFKPSFGLIPLPGNVEQVGHVGPLSRSVDDAAVFLDAVAGPDDRDRFSLNASGIEFAHAAAAGVAGLRVGWSPDLGYASVDPEVARITERAALAFRELGCEVLEARPDFGDPCSVFEIISATSEAGEWGTKEKLAAVSALLDPGRLEHINLGWKFSGGELAAAYAARTDFYMRVRSFMREYDLLLTPTLPITAFPAGLDHPGRGTARSEGLCWQAFTYPFNMTGQPAASVPCGLAPDGLPVGLQIVGRWRADSTVLAASRAFEEARPWRHLIPSIAD